MFYYSNNNSIDREDCQSMNLLFHLSSDALDIISTYTLMNETLKKKRHNIHPVLIYLCFIAHMGLLYLCEHIYIATLPLSIIANILVLFLLTFLFEAKTVLRVLTTSISLIITLVSERLLEALVLPSMPDLMKYTNDETIYNSMMLGCSIIDFLLTFIAIYLWRQFMSKNGSFNNPIILITPALSFLQFEALPLIFPNNTNFPAFLLLFTLINAGINIVNYHFINYVIKYHDLRERHQILTYQLKAQKEKYAQISSSYRETRRIVHDTKKHYLAIDSHIEKEQYTKLREYLKEALYDLDNTYSKINTGNLVIDALVSNSVNIANERGIVMEYDIHIDKDIIKTDDYDLSIIIGNLLENAINACSDSIVKDKPKLQLTIFTDNDNNLVFKLKNPIPASKKSSDSETNLYHGYGLENVKNTVSKLNGTYIIDDKNGIFDVSIVLPNID